MSQVKVKSFVFELFGGRMCLTVMTLDNSKQILIYLELSRYQGLTVFTPGILDKGKFKESCPLFPRRLISGGQQ